MVDLRTKWIFNEGIVKKKMRVIWRELMPKIHLKFEHVKKKLVRKLSFLASNTRPYLVVYTLYLLKKQKYLVVKDLRSVNRIRQKVRERKRLKSCSRGLVTRRLFV